jgi:hypothetical protein
MKTQRNLLEIVDTSRPTSRFSGCLDCRQQQGDQYPDDGDDHQQFNQRETSRSSSANPGHCRLLFDMTDSSEMRRMTLEWEYHPYLAKVANVIYH